MNTGVFGRRDAAVRCEWFGKCWAVSDPQGRAFEKLSTGLSHWSKDQLRPSGVCRDTGALEFSLRETRGGRSLRYIIDPWAFASGDEHALQVVVDHVTAWGEASTAGRLAELVEDLGAHAAGHQGSFRMWIGASVSPRGEVVGKVYFNPWLWPTETGLDNVERMLHRLGGPSVPAPLVARVFDDLGAMLPHIVGANFGPQGVDRAKVYFVSPGASRDDLARFADDFGIGSLRTILAREELLDQGEIHVNVSCRDADDPTGASISLSVPTWFPDAQSAMTLLEEILSSSTLSRLRPFVRHDWQLSFIGLAQNNVTVYVHPTAGSAPLARGVDSAVGEYAGSA